MSPHSRWFGPRKFLLSLTLCLAALAGADSRSSAGVVGKQSPAPSDPVPHLREADDVGRFVAGLSGMSGSVFDGLEQGAAWKQHRRLLDNAWRKADAGLVSHLRDFEARELSPSVNPDSIVFYPFSGPDALTVTVFFPHAPVYVMVGLEPAGTLPTLRQIKDHDLSAYLGAVRGTMASELGRSFFVTREMDKEFRGQVTDGLLVPILHSLVRTGHTVLGFRYVRLNESGLVIDRAPTYKAPGRIGNKGIEIEFRTEADRSVHKLYYFTVNLSDELLRQDQPFATYVSGLRGAVTFLKATSYMTHRPDFSMIRDLILANSSAILQDDSGIPYTDFQPDRWKVQLYGRYDRPYGSFRWMEQPGLRSAYKAAGVKPLGLRIGYGYARVASNLQLAKRDGPVQRGLRH
jgi:hypothetical protein